MLDVFVLFSQLYNNSTRLVAIAWPISYFFLLFPLLLEQENLKKFLTPRPEGPDFLWEVPGGMVSARIEPHIPVMADGVW